MKAKRIKDLDPAAPLAEGAARIVKVRLAELLKLRERALDEADVEAQHDTRIAAKRLRYVLEATGFCLGPPADAARPCSSYFDAWCAASFSRQRQSAGWADGTWGTPCIPWKLMPHRRSSTRSIAICAGPPSTRYAASLDRSGEKL